MRTRRTALLVGGVLAALVAAGMFWPHEPEVLTPSFPGGRKVVGMRGQSYPDPKEAYYAHIIVRPTEGPWHERMEALHGDLTAQGFDRTSLGSQYATWRKGRTFVLASSFWQKKTGSVFKGFTIIRPATPPEAASCWLVERLGGR